MEVLPIQQRYDRHNRPPIAFARSRVLATTGVAGNAPSDERSALRWFDGLLARLGPQEYRRRFGHFVPGVLALVGAWIPHQGPFVVVVATFVICGVLATVALYGQEMIRRPNERNCLAAILGYAAAVIPLFLVFPSQPELALAVAGIIAFGDGSATLAGLLARSRRLPWNANKSWAGTAAFIAVGLPMATLIFWHGSVPHPSPELVVLCVGPAVLVSALVESLPIPGNDNLLVGASAGATIVLMHGLLGA